MFITLSNLGDVILTLPVLDFLKGYAPEAEITVMVGPRPKEVFENNPAIHKLIIYDKYAPLREKVKLFHQLKQERFDAVIDLRNTLYGALLPARYRTSPFLRIPKQITHMKERNLYRLKKALGVDGFFLGSKGGKSLFVGRQDKEYIEQMLVRKGIGSAEKLVLIAPVARGANRRWGRDKFVELCNGLGGRYRVILVGTAADKEVASYICSHVREKVFDFVGTTSLLQLAYLVEKSALVIGGDTGVLQIASYQDVPVLLLAGAGDEKKYGPWSRSQTALLTREVFCRPCSQAQCRFGTVDCLRLIQPQEVINKAEELLGVRQSVKQSPRAVFKRILLVRTDRLGDVVLSPYLKA